jgi:PPOX class probable F420-dependent enzyme
MGDLVSRGMTSTLTSLKSAKTILLTTYKRDGTAVGTPVSIAFDGDRAFFRSYDKAWKTKRLRRDPRVRAAPSTLRGAPTGPAIRARATLLEVSRRALPRAHWRETTASCRESSSPRCTVSCGIAPCTTS